MAYIREQKRSGKYQVRWWDSEGRQRERVCSTKRDALTLKLAVESARSEGRDWQPEITGAAPLLRDVAKKYIDKRKVRWRKDTARMDGTYLDVFLRFADDYADRKAQRPTVRLLSRPMLEDYLLWLAKPETSVHGKAREQTTITKFVRAAQRVWVWAEESDRWPGEIPRPRLLSREDLPESRTGDVEAPDWTDMDRCVLACREGGPLWRLAVWLRYTGLRAGESMQFKWSDIDMERGELTIRREIDKRKAGRTVPLSKHLLAELEKWKREEWGREGYVIPSSRKAGEREREPRARDMARAWKRAGVREAVWKRRPDHAFRHGFKSMLLAEGAHIDAVDHLQGHKLGAGSRGNYIDPSKLRPLQVKALALMPPIDTSKAKVLPLPTATARR